MKRFKKFIAAFLLAVFVSSVPFAPQARAGIVGDIISGIISGVQKGAEYAELAAQTVKLAELISSVGNVTKEVKKVSEGVQAVVRFAQTGVYSIRSLRLIGEYSRTLSQFVSDLATGRFYNYASAVYAAQHATYCLSFLTDIVKDLDSFLKTGKSAEGVNSMVSEVYNQVSTAYAQLCTDINGVVSQNRRAAATQLAEAGMMSIVQNLGPEAKVNRYMNQYEAVAGDAFSGMSMLDLLNTSVFNINL